MQEARVRNFSWILQFATDLRSDKRFRNSRFTLISVWRMDMRCLIILRENLENVDIFKFLIKNEKFYILKTLKIVPKRDSGGFLALRASLRTLLDVLVA